MRTLTLRIILGIGAASVAWPAFAHGGHPQDRPPAWTWSPWITVPLGISALMFLIGWLRLRQRSARGRFGRRGLFFALGWVVLAGALVSPLHEAGERSFAAHMLEHELLMLMAAPLLVLSEPMAILLWGWPAGARKVLGGIALSGPVRGLWRGLTGLVVATLLQAAALLLWHSPALFDRALANEDWHIAQHISFLFSALLFWTATLGASRSRAGDARGFAALCLFATSIISGALGAMMAFSESPWYLGYAELGMAPFGLTPAQDQQLAGLIMWVPGGLVHALAALGVIAGLLNGERPHREVARVG